MLEYTMCTKILQHKQVNEIGLSLLGNDLSPFLNTGTTWAYFHSAGIGRHFFKLRAYKYLIDK